MGLIDKIRRLFAKQKPLSSGRDGSRDPRKGILARIPESRLMEYHPLADLAENFPSIPRDHLRVLVAFIRIGATEVGLHGDTDGKLETGLHAVCQMYVSGRVKVVRAGSEWQVRQP